jgi:dTDP-L-rhamnose 4-epimerase
MNILITGGAGFIGRHLCAALSAEGHALTVLDNFSAQVHDASSIEAFRSSFRGRLVQGDVRDRDAWEQSLPGQDAVVHLAAETGTGQSMYEVERYEAVNIRGTALMLDCLVNGRHDSVRKLVVASSRAIYGEGRYRCPAHGVVHPTARDEADMKAGLFEPRCPTCGSFVDMLATVEESPMAPTSFYGLTKQVQEQMVLMYGRVLGISAYALRYQNVYGPGQSLNNPYTGILAIFSNLAREHKPINVFEDGKESRDFVYIDDVVRATAACLAPQRSGVLALNVGSGVSTPVETVARSIIARLGSRSSLAVSGAFRKGDIRHNVADLALATEAIGFQPQVAFADGLASFLDWAQRGSVGQAAYEASLQELRAKGLMHG